MSHIHGFPPVATPAARVLVLGTMPGKASLRAQRYYAHPRNSFWKIVGEILGFDPGCDYGHKLSSLVAADLALWDVLQSCARASSLDSDIDRESVVTNDFAAFFAGHPGIRRVCFNGAAAERLYLRHVRPSVACPAEIEHIRLPSTSPANAGICYAEKLRAWRVIAPGAPIRT